MLNNWKEILQKRREKLSRQIEYRRLKRIRRKQTPVRHEGLEYALSAFP